jgi:cytochrome b6-f complex iron-sulfur subunit
MTNKAEAISRTKFLKSLGLNGAALFAAVYCTGSLVSCTNEAETVNPSNPGDTSLATLDLSTATYTKLNTKGNYVIVNNIVIANTSDGIIVAVPLTCSHEGRKEVTYKTNEFYCTAHGARFSNAGKGLNSEGSGGLKLYTVTQVGTVITIK